jgi:phage baseplate assembly protein V
VVALMGLDRDALAQIRQLLRPLATRVANSIARAVVQLVDDGKNLQHLQVGILAGEDGDDAEHHQAYGFSSVPLAGAEAVVVFPNGDRGHPLVVAVSDRRHRPTGGEPGEVTVYNHTGAKILMTEDGDIEVTPAPGRVVFVRTEGGDAEPIVKRSEFLAHGHPVVATGAVSPTAGPVTGVAPAGLSATFPGTTVLKAE